MGIWDCKIYDVISRCFIFVKGPDVDLFAPSNGINDTEVGRQRHACRMRYLCNAIP